MKTEFSKYDVADYLKTDEDIVFYLEACFEEAGDDAAFIAAALGDIARARGMSDIAEATGLTRGALPHPFEARQSEFQRHSQGDESLGIEAQAGSSLSCIMRFLILLACLFTTPATADDLQDRAQRVFNCMSNNGLTTAGAEHPQGCIGMMSTPCIEGISIPGDAQMMDCLGQETEAWDKLLNDAYNEARQTRLTAEFNALRQRQRAWLKSREKQCALPENFGTAERLAGFNCFLDTTAKRVIAMYRELNLIRE